MFQNQRDGLTEIREALFMRLALTIRTGNFRAVRNVPRAFFLNDRSEFITHALFYRCLMLADHGWAESTWPLNALLTEVDADLGVSGRQLGLCATRQSALGGELNSP
jgi:hypothetical protein